MSRSPNYLAKFIFFSSYICTTLHCLGSSWVNVSAQILDIKVNQLNLVRAEGSIITVNDEPVNVTYMHGWSSTTSGKSGDLAIY